MAKAINWPLTFRDEIIAEDCETERLALRVGDLYFQNRYWVPGEVVDIRVNHKKIRKATVVGDLRQCPIAAIPPDDLAKLKRSLQSPEAIVQFLAETYNQPVDSQTLVTLVTYRNQPIVPEELEEADDPHM